VVPDAVTNGKEAGGRRDGTDVFASLQRTPMCPRETTDGERDKCDVPDR
jgi:hypothetical protein